MAAYFSHEAIGATMRYSLRCEKFALAMFLNNSQKNIKKSQVQEVYQKSDILEHRICFYSAKLFLKNTIFRENR